MIRGLLLLILCSYSFVGQAQYWETHWKDSNYEFTGTGGSAVSVTKTDCEEALLKVADPIGMPLPAFSPLIINPKDSTGDDITDVSNFPLQINIRVRSVAEVVMGFLLRSDDGTSDFRTTILYDTIPADLTNWSEVVVSFSEDEVAGFNANNLRDVWIYLDRGTENFNGDELYIDYISLGGPPTTGLASPCDLAAGAMEPLYADYFNGEHLQGVSTTSIAGQVTTFTLDTNCETLQLSVSDPVNAPLPSFNAYVVNPIDSQGNDISDISDQVNVSMRVRSVEALQIDVLFRSGGGSQEERTSRKSVSIPANLGAWTDVYIEFAPTELEGFDPADLRDFWFYLDRGTPNFPGNEFYIDHIVIGGAPNPANNSPCSTEVAAQSWMENWDNSNPTIFGGAETLKLTLTTTDCEELKIEVADPALNPHSEFRPIVVNPLTPGGSEITNISGNVQLVIRARSAEEIPIGVLFRSGDGSADFRTAIKTQNVAGTLEAWTTLRFEFTAEELGGFDPEDLIDFWIFLDRSNPNFPGNELYFDYITIGAQLDTTENSPCGLPDSVVSSEEVSEIPTFTVYPNPVLDLLHINLELNRSLGKHAILRLFGARGDLKLQQQITAGQSQIRLDVSGLARGMYFLEIQSDSGRFTRSILKP